MQIDLPIQAAFLHAHFPRTRARLIGVETNSFGAGTVEMPLAYWQRLSSGVFAKITAKFHWFSSISIVIAVIGLAVFLGPDLYYYFFPADTKPVIAVEQGTPLGGNFAEGTQAKPVVTPQPSSTASASAKPLRVLPPQDNSLPTGTWVIIPRIGVRSQLDPSLTADEALANGVWMAPDYGLPGDLTKPVILAAHRYGWQ